MKGVVSMKKNLFFVPVNFKACNGKSREMYELNSVV